MIFSKFGGVNDSIYGKSQYPISMMIEEEEQAYLKTTQIDKVYNMRPSNKFGEKFSTMTAKADFEITGEGGAFPRTNTQVGYEKTIEPEEWKNSFEITKTMIEDAETFDVSAYAKDFTTSYARTREKYGAFIFNNGNSATGTFGKKTISLASADGVALFSTAHTSITGGTTNQTNFFNGAFSYDNLCLVEEYMQKFTDDDGNLLNIQPDTIIIPNNARIKKLVFDAVCTTSGAPGTGNNSFNFNEGRWNIIVWNQLQNPSGATGDSWYLMDSKKNQVDGLMWLDRVPLTVDSWIDQNTGNNIFGGRSRFGMGANNWRSVAGCMPGQAGTSL